MGDIRIQKFLYMSLQVKIFSVIFSHSSIATWAQIPPECSLPLGLCTIKFSDHLASRFKLYSFYNISKNMIFLYAYKATLQADQSLSKF